MVNLNKAILCCLFVSGFFSTAFCTITQSANPATAGCTDVFQTDISGTAYQWNFGANAYPLTSSGSSASATTLFLTAGSHTVIVTVTTAGGPVADSITINVAANASNISIAATNPHLCQLTTDTFTASPAYSMYAFFVNDSLWQNSPSNTFIYDFGFGNDSIRVFGLNGGCYTNASQTLHSTPAPPSPTLTSSGDTICGGYAITFTVTPPVYDIYQFYIGASLVNTQTSNVWVTANVYNMNEVLVYGVTNGCTSAYPSATDTIVVKPTPKVTIALSDSGACQGTPITVTASFSQISSVDGYSFYINSTLEQTGGSNSYTTSTLSNGDTIIGVATYQGCTSNPDSSFKIVSVNAQPVITVTGPDTVCPASPAIFIASPTGYSNYVFYNNGALVQNGTSANYAAGSLVNGNAVYAIATNTGCAGLPSDTVNAFVLPSIPVNAGVDTTFCLSSPPDTITGFTPAGGTWSGQGITDPSGIFSPANAGVGAHPLVYSFTDPNTGCPNRDTAIYTVNQPLTLTVSPTNPGICQNQSIQLKASGASFYQWSPGSGLSDSTIANPVASPAQTTTYTVIGADKGGCANSATVTVTVNTGATAAFTFNQACARQATQFTNTTTPATGTTYAWNFGDGSTSLQQNPSHNYITSDTFNVLLVAQFGSCLDSISQPVFVYPAATAAFEATPLYSYNDNNSPVHFINSSTGAEGYTWNFGDQIISNDTSPLHNYKDPGLYSITLVASNQYGCNDSVTKENYIRIYEAPKIYVPNSFTPNGDNINDVLHVFTIGAKFMDFKIFDRLGELVYESNNVDGENATEGWDGRYRAKDKGEYAPTGVYTYFLRVVFEDNTSRTYDGTITLIR